MPTTHKVGASRSWQRAGGRDASLGEAGGYGGGQTEEDWPRRGQSGTVSLQGRMPSIERQSVRQVDDRGLDATPSAW
jgi:hypothetical protein